MPNQLWGATTSTTNTINTSFVNFRFLSTRIPSMESADMNDNNSNNFNSPAEVRSSNPSRFWAYNTITGRAQRPIFVAATKQHVGKTTTCLAVLSGLQKRFNKVGFLKPVGQQHVEVTDKNHKTLRVDKDVVLIKEHFHLDHMDYRYMSPVIIPRGYTKSYVDGEITLETQRLEVEGAMEHIAANCDITLIEGTGHCAVGSIVGLNNAKVASLLGADMVLM
jgi:AAA domain